MEENKAKTTRESAESSPADNADAGIVTSESSDGTPSSDNEQATVNDTLFADGSPSSEREGVEGDTSGSVPAAKETATSDARASHAAEDAAARSAAEREREKNREHARRRREAEKANLIRETREKAILEALDGRNPYTGEDMRDSADVEEYLAMKEIEKSGGDPISDYSKYRKQKERDARRAEEERLRTEAWYRDDRAAFVAKYPSVDLEALIADDGFRRYAKGKVGEVPLAEIYEDFTDLVGKYEERAKEMAAQRLANRNASPGALGTSQGVQSDILTADQVRKMSPAEVRANYEKIRNSMKHWK